MYINSNNKIIYSDYEKKNNITVDKNLIRELKDNNYPLFFNNIHFVQKYHRQYGNQKLINKCIKDTYDIANNQKKYYSQVVIPKRNGEDRVLNVPSRELKHLQKYILNNVLSWYEPLDCVMGYVKGKGIKENALMHVNSKYILKLDISDFFGSIHFGKIVNNILPDVYDKNLKVLLANLCMLDGSLPQGAPTSPTISNIVMHKFDEIISKYCKDNNLIYTRYADDMFISSENDFEYKKVIHKIEHLLRKYYSMKLNKDKAHYLHDGLKEELCGVVVNEKVQTSKRYRDSIRQEIHYLDKYGVEKHIYALFYDKKIDSVITPLEYYRKLIGKINHVLNINPEDTKFKEYRTKINKYIDELQPKKEVESDTRRYPAVFNDYFDTKDELHFDYENASVEEKILYNFMNGIHDDDEDLDDEAYEIGAYMHALHQSSSSPNRINIIFKTMAVRYSEFYTKAYDENDLWATYMLMVYLVNKKNDDMQLVHYWCERLASFGFYRGLMIKSQDIHDLDLLKKCADNRDPKAQFIYAKNHCPIYSSEYIKYMLACAENNYPPAFFRVARLYMKFELYEEAYYWAIKGSLIEDNDCLELANHLSKEKGYKLPKEVEELLEDYDDFEDE